MRSTADILRHGRRRRSAAVAGFARPRSRRRDQAPRRLPAHAGGRRPDLARPAIAAASTSAASIWSCVQFTTGLEMFQAMIGGSLDVLSTGAVRLELPGARPGQGVPDQQHRVRDRAALGARRLGHQVVRRPEGQAHRHHDRHHRARLPRHARCAPTSSTRPRTCEIVNQRMAEAVTSFISGAVPAVALWVPFDVTVRRRSPDARKTRRRIGLLSRRPRSSAAGPRATTSTSRTSRRWPR